MNPILISIGNFEIRYYSAFLLLAVIIGFVIILKEGRKFLITDDYLVNLCFWVMIFGVIGARIYYVIFNWELYQDNLLSILKIWNGGLAIHGGLIAGFITLIVYTKKHNLNILRMSDILSASVIIAQAIGRWGNFFNGEAHGMATNLTTLKSLFIPNFIIRGMDIGGIYYHPTFYYESLWCFVGFIVIMIIRRLKYVKVGQQTCIYLMWYSFGRFFIESMRTDSLMLGAFKVAQILSIILFIGALAVFMIVSRKGKFEDLYNENKDVKVKFY